ncbi:uncharacterized protein IL334_004681 [Kwoniella shivajii]|uniref:Zn(2)-C6 fungal-type domain-containing protein n=1 Tax=Kwoniella shivajii TaxID=564305 RepID=A0ABZ1D2E7_9TREE|nr:hypothetical protein IL334_004681 [Kwoniella shivajii]
MQSEAGPSTVVLTEKRGLKACTACRIAKVRCQIISGIGICVRCQSAAISCTFTAARRGRVKGSKKNGSSTGSSIEPITQDLGLGWTAGLQPSVNQVEESLHPASVGVSATRAQSPLDPFVSNTSGLVTPVHQQHREHGLDPPSAQNRMTRRTVQIMAGSFPTGSDRSLSEIVPRADFSTGKDVHNPLLFLAECARRGWDASDASEWRDPMIVPAPGSNLPLDDAIRLGRWSKENLGKIMADQRKYFQHGLHGTKRDVSIGLDPVYQNVIREEQVEELFASYFCHVHVQCGMLDRNIHTPSFVRSRSSFLFTVILALGATTAATSPISTPQDRLLTLKLWAHLEKLQLVICATAAKSLEIVQGMLLAQMWALRSPRLVDDQRATRLGMAVRMAGQIGLQLAKHHGKSPGEQSNTNDLRTRLSLVLVESRWESIADRQEISCQGFDLTEFEAEELDRSDPLSAIALMAGDYALYRFEAESKERLSRIIQTTRSTIAMDSERIWIRTHLSSWEDTWVKPQTDPLRQWWFRYLSIRSRLVGILRVAKARVHPGPWTDQMKTDLVLVSTELMEGCLSHEKSLHMLRPTSPIVFAAAILLQLTGKEAKERDLILRVALRLAGDPRQEDVMTYATHNGYQILNMLWYAFVIFLIEFTWLTSNSLSKEVDRGIAGPISDDMRNVHYNEGASFVSDHSMMMEENHIEQNLHSMADPAPQPFSDIDQLLGISGSTDFLQWSNGPEGANHHTATEHQQNTTWNSFLSTEPLAGNVFPSAGLSGNTAGVTWNGNGDDPYNLTGGRQMSDNAMSDFYFHLASALGS